MSRFTLPLASLAAFALVAACSSATLSPQGKGEEATLMVSPRIQSGGYATQAVVNPYTGADVSHLVITLHTVAGATETQVATADLPKADLAKTLVFGKLRNDLTYRIRAHAYKAAGIAPANLISLDASSSVDVVVGREDTHAVTLTVQLIDRPFSGATTIPGATVTDGQFVASGSVTVTASPAPIE